MKKIIVFYDSWCAMCHWAVRFVLKHDKNKRFVFASLDGKTAEKKLCEWFKEHPNIDSIVVMDGEKIYWYSKAVFAIAWHLRFPWKLIGVLHFLPRFFLYPCDFLYKVIARRRSRSCDISGTKQDDTDFLP